MRIKAMLAIIGIEMVVFALVVSQDAVLGRAIRSHLPVFAQAGTPPTGDRDGRNDPPLGLALPWDGTGAVIRRTAGDSRGGYLVVPVGGCPGCTKLDFRQLEAAADRLGVRLVLVTTSPNDEAARMRKELRLSSPVVSDMGGNLVKGLNSYWNGRAYLFSSAWRLKWMSRDPSRRTDPLSESGFSAAVEGIAHE